MRTEIKEFSDMCSFVEAGVPSTWIWETSVTSIHSHYHTERDTIYFIDLNRLVRTLDVNGLLIHRIANSRYGVRRNQKNQLNAGTIHLTLPVDLGGSITYGMKLKYWNRNVR